MPLSTCNIRDLLTEQLTTYLKENNPSFTDLKSNITAKAPIPEVNTYCFKLLSDLKKSDRLKVKKTLETQFSKKQIAEDEKQSKADSAAESKDDETKKRLTRDLEHIPRQLINYENRLITLRQKLSRLMSAARADTSHNQQVSKKSSKSSKKKSVPLDDNSVEIETLRTSIDQYELKIRTLTTRQFENQSKLNEIEDREQPRLERKRDRSNRSDARAGYQISGEGFPETLSPTRHEQFSRRLKEQYTALDRKQAELTQEAQTLNFPLFIELLPKHLDKLKLNAPEKEALRTILKLMRKHLDCEQQLAISQDLLSRKKQSISHQIFTLNDLDSQLKNLQKKNPDLIENNKKLREQNTELETSQKHNIEQRKRMALPGLLLLTLSPLSTIPLILTATGIIPFFIAPALLFTLFALPPALFLTATIAVAITALVFYVKGRLNESAIISNLQTIISNKKQAKIHNQNLATLKNETIPSAEKQIKNDELERDKLGNSIKQAQIKAQQFLKQAIEIEPISFAKSTVLTDESSELSISNHSDEDIEDYEDDAAQEGEKKRPT